MSSPDAETLSPRRAQTRARLIEAAAAAIADKGFHNATLDEIAERANLTKGAIYDNFKSKEELFVAVMARRRVGPEWPKERNGTAKQRLRKLAKAVVADNEEAKQLAPLRAEFLLYLLTHEEMKPRIAELVAAQIKVVEERIRALFDTEEIIMPPHEFAILLENFVPSLVYSRSLAPEAMNERSLIKIFESFAAQQD